MRFAYADPPYLGLGTRHYRDHPDAQEYDTLAAHLLLLERLQDDYPDGWVLSLSEPSLRHTLPHTPERTRTCAWVKPFAIFKVNVGVAHAWEPVLLYGGRRRTRQEPTVRDWLAENITLKIGLTGTKPDRFCAWVLSLLNAQPEDTVDDLFPGTGGLTRVWGDWTADSVDIGGILRKP